MKNFKKILLFFVVIALFFTQLPSKNVQASTLRTDLTMLTDAKDNDSESKSLPANTYYTSEIIRQNINLGISGNDVNTTEVLNNAKLVLKFDRKYVDEEPVLQRQIGEKSFSLVNNGTHWVATYVFDTLEAGRRITARSSFRHNRIVTPNNLETKVVATLETEAGDVLNTSEQTYTVKTRNTTIGKSNAGYNSTQTVESKIVNEYFIDGLRPGEETNTKTGSEAPQVTHVIRVGSPNQYQFGFGLYYPARVRVVDTLPTGAVPAGTVNGNGKYEYFGKEWTYDAVANTLTYEGPHSAGLDNGNVDYKVTLAYPNFPYKSATNEAVITNKASAVADPGTDKEFNIGNSESHFRFVAFTGLGQPEVDFEKKVVSIRADGAWKKVMYTNDGTANNFKIDWYIRYSNKNSGQTDPQGNTASTKVKYVEDYELDTHLYYDKISISSKRSNNSFPATSQIVNKGYIVYGVKADGSKVEIARNVAIDTDIEINDTQKQYVKLRIEPEQADSDFEMSNHEERINISTKILPTYVQKWFDNVEPLHTGNMTNFARSEMKSYGDTEYNEKMGRDSIGLVTTTASAGTWGNLTVTYNPAALDSDQFIFQTGFLHTYTKGGQGDILRNGKQIIVFPEGMEFTPNSFMSTYGTGRYYGLPNSSPQLELVENFKNTGRQALIYHIGDIDTNSPSAIVNTRYNVRVSINAKTGANTIDNYFVWDNNDVYAGGPPSYVVGFPARRYTDALDLDGDGNKDEAFLHAPTYLTFSSQDNFLLKKYVGLSMDDTFSLRSKHVDIGSEVYYKTALSNNSILVVNEMEGYDVLPSLNDTAIVPNRSGAYLPRNSQYNVTMVRSLESIAENAAFLDKFNVLYSTDAQGSNYENTKAVTWKTEGQITDFTAVKMIKFVLKPGKTMAGGEVLEYYTHGKVPNNTSLNNNDTAVASTAYEFTENGVSVALKPAVEGNAVRTPIVKYSVTGTIFNDKNQDGIIDDTGDIKLPGYTVRLMNEDGTPAKDLEGREITTTSNSEGQYSIDVYKRGKYYVEFTLKSDAQSFTRLHTSTGTNGNDATFESGLKGKSTTFDLNPFSAPNSLKAVRNAGIIIPSTSFTVNKVWVNGPAEKPSIEVQLYRNGVAFGDVVTLNNGTTSHTWNDLDANDASGTAYTYSVDEVNVPEHYSKEVAGNTITNTYVSPKTTYTVNKVWVNGPAEKPSIEVQLYRNGVAFGDVVTLNNGTTSHTWNDLDANDASGTAYTYSVDEVNVPEHYSKEVAGNTITNTYVSPKTTYTVNKVWVNGPAEKPSIEVQLYRNGVAFGDVVTLNNGTTSHTWNDLDANDASGTAYTYSVDEVNVPEHYSKEVAGNTITNTYVSPKTTYTVNKVWVNGPAEKPSIEVQLYRNGVAFGDVVTLNNGTTSHTWNDLDANDASGTAYTYSVDEVNVPEHYSKEVAGNTITNTYVSPKTTYTVNKVWVNGPAEKPSIEVQLYRNGVAFGDVVTLNNGTTSHTWNDLDANDASGTAYTYSVDEVNVPEHYSKEVAGNTITNTYVSPKTTYTVNKVWVNGPAEKPSIEVQLYRNGVAFGDVVTLNNGTTSHTWNDLDANDASGTAYTYSVDEVNVPEHYSKEVAGNTITNTYVSPKTTYTVNKVWVNGPAEKPSIEVQLYRNGVAFGDVVTLNNGTTSHTWNDLDANDASGTAYTYSVDEVNVPEHYSKEVAGNTITNTYIPPVTKKPVDTSDRSVNYVSMMMLMGIVFLVLRKQNKA